MPDVVISLLRAISFWVDNIVYDIISKAYELLMYIASVDIFNDNQYFSELMDRIYILIGIFMLFKVSFSIIQYIADPNAFTDKGKGFSKLITNVLVAIVLLVSVPTIFSKLYEFQNFVLKSNAIGNLIMGTNFSESKSVKSMATDTQFMLFSAFATVNPEMFNTCEKTPVLGSKAMAKTGQMNGKEVATGNCLGDIYTAMSNNADLAEVSLNDFFKDASSDEENRKFSSFYNMVLWKDGKVFALNYIPIVSTFAGGFVALLLIVFCVDVAVRVIKLCFLQVVAPISIISYVDPKESISQSKLANWVKETVSTYLSLFIRLAAIFLSMVLISVIASTIFADGGLSENVTYLNDSTPDATQTMFIYVFLVIGAFMFAKKVPELIENLFGIKSSGSLHLASVGKAMGGMALGGALGTVGALTGAGAGRVLTGAASGLLGGARGKKLGEIASMGADANRRLGIARANGSTVLGRMHARVSNALGTSGTMGRIMNQRGRYDDVIANANKYITEKRSDIQDRENFAEEVDKGHDRAMTKIQEKDNNSTQAKEWRKKIFEEETLRNKAANLRSAAAQARAAADWEARSEESKEAVYDMESEAEDLIKEANQKSEENAEWLKNEGAYGYMNDVDEGKLSDESMTQILKNVEYKAGLIGVDYQKLKKTGNLGKALDDKAGKERGKISKLKREVSPYERQKASTETAKEALQQEREAKARANIEAVQGKEGGPRMGGRGPWGGPGGPGPRH